MARNFTGFPVQPYIGIPFFKPVTVCRGNGEPWPVVPLVIEWNSYSAFINSQNQIGVSVNLEGIGGSKPPLSKIEAVWIDNSFSATPLFVFFPDTGYVAAAGANRITLVPVYTNGLNCVIFADNIDLSSTLFTRVQLHERYVSEFNIDTTFNSLLPRMSYDLLANTVSTGNLTTYNFAAVDTGPSEDRRLCLFVAGVTAGVARQFSSATIGGKAISAFAGAGVTGTALLPELMCIGDFLATDPAGSQTVSITFSGAMVGCAIALVRVYDMQAALPYATRNAAVVPVNTTLVNMTGYGGGLMFGYAQLDNGESASMRHSLSVFQPSQDADIQLGFNITAGSFTWLTLSELFDTAIDTGGIANVLQGTFFGLR